MIQKALGLAAVALVMQFGAAAHAAKTASVKSIVTILKVPVMIEKADGTNVPVSELNQDLKKARTPELEEYITISTDDKDTYKTVEAYKVRVEASIQLIGKAWTDASFQGPLFPTAGDDGNHQTCYKGDAHAVSDLVNASADSIFSEQLSQFAMKYKKETVFYNAVDEVETDKLLEAESALWKSWKGDDESILILSSVGDDGDDVQESLIPVCK